MELIFIALVAIIYGGSFVTSPQPQEAAFGQGMLTAAIPLFIFALCLVLFYEKPKP